MIKKLTKQFYIAVEGDTECHYFAHLQKLINNDPRCKTKVDLKVKKVSKPSSYVKSYSILQSSILYCVYDVEGLSSNDTNRFDMILKDATASKNKKDFQYKLAYSNLSFEMWIILHKQANCPVVDTKEGYCITINKVFNKHFENLSHYKKENNFNSLLQSILLDDVLFAITNAKQLEQRNSSETVPTKYGKHQYFKKNPATSLHALVEEILECSGILNSTKELVHD